MIWLTRKCSAVLGLILTGLISFYQLFLSPLLGVNCRHLPSCSQYAKDALKTHGLLRGSYFALKRIGRCHPWVEPMVDPVPPPPSDGSTPVTKVKG